MAEFAPPSFQQQSVQLRRWWITALLIAINVGLFLWQVLHGMNISQPAIADAIYWGADYAPLTFLAEPQRLFSSMFFHFGLIHLMLNMWALYIFGSVAEQLFGHRFFIGLYLLAGLMGSLYSGYTSIQSSLLLLQNFDPADLPRVSAGASGAVMGLGGALTVLSLLPPLPRQTLLLDKKSLLIIMGINLAMGMMIAGINNAAHLGGMMMGAGLALLWYTSQRVKLAWGGLLALMLGSGLCWWLYQDNLQQLEVIQPIWQSLLHEMLRKT